MLCTLGCRASRAGSGTCIGGLPHPHFPKKCTQCAQCGPSVGGKHFFDPFSHFMHTFFEYIHTLFRGDTLYEHFFMGVTPLYAHFILMMKHLRHTFGSLGDHFSRFACTCVTLWSHFHLPAPAPAPAPATGCWCDNFIDQRGRCCATPPPMASRWPRLGSLWRRSAWW